MVIVTILDAYVADEMVFDVDVITSEIGETAETVYGPIPPDNGYVILDPLAVVAVKTPFGLVPAVYPIPAMFSVAPALKPCADAVVSVTTPEVIEAAVIITLEPTK
jgi:hypothetical protein